MPPPGLSLPQTHHLPNPRPQNATPHPPVPAQLPHGVHQPPAGPDADETREEDAPREVYKQAEADLIAVGNGSLPSPYMLPAALSARQRAQIHHLAHWNDVNTKSHGVWPNWRMILRKKVTEHHTQDVSMGAVSSSQQAAASVAVPQAVPQSDDPGAVMVIATPVEVSPSGSLILILCNDPQHDIFMNAKQRIVHLPVVHETRTIPTLTDIMKQHGWRASPTMDYHEMDVAVIETGRDKGLCGVGQDKFDRHMFLSTTVFPLPFLP